MFNIVYFWDMIDALQSLWNLTSPFGFILSCFVALFVSIAIQMLKLMNLPIMMLHRLIEVPGSIVSIYSFTSKMITGAFLLPIVIISIPAHITWNIIHGKESLESHILNGVALSEQTTNGLYWIITLVCILIVKIMITQILVLYYYSGVWTELARLIFYEISCLFHDVSDINIKQFYARIFGITFTNLKAFIVIEYRQLITVIYLTCRFRGLTEHIKTNVQRDLTMLQGYYKMNKME